MSDKGKAMFGKKQQKKAEPADEMSVRDRFAAAALTGLLGCVNGTNYLTHDGERVKLAHLAYLIADAMMAERKPAATDNPSGG